MNERNEHRAFEVCVLAMKQYESENNGNRTEIQRTGVPTKKSKTDKTVDTVWYAVDFFCHETA